MEQPQNVVFVGQVPRDMSESELRTVMEECGHVSSVNMLTDRQTGAFKGREFSMKPISFVKVCFIRLQPMTRHSFLAWIGAICNPRVQDKFSRVSRVHTTDFSAVPGQKSNLWIWPTFWLVYDYLKRFRVYIVNL